MLQIINKRKYTYTFSAILILLSVFAVAMWGIRPNSDFTGGTTVEFSLSADADVNRDNV